MPDPGLYEAMYEENVRIEEAWPFPITPAPERLIEALSDGMDCKDFPAALAPYFARLTDEQQAELGDGGNEAVEVLSEMAGDMFCDGVLGWVAIAATPVFTPTGARSSSFSWGHYHTGLVFAETGEALIGAAVEWARVQHEQDAAKAAA